MGAGNVALVLIRWSPYLNDKPFRALVQMALTSMDGADPPRFWGGWAPIARAVGAQFPTACEVTSNGGACSGCPECWAAQRAAGRAVAGLLATGVIELLVKPRKGRNAEYALRIDRQPTAEVIHRYGSKAPSEGGARRTPSVVQASDAERLADTGRSASPLPDAQRRAEEEAGGVSGIGAETRSPWPGTSPAAVPVENAKCGICKWLVDQFGHAPGCRAAA